MPAQNENESNTVNQNQALTVEIMPHRTGNNFLGALD